MPNGKQASDARFRKAARTKKKAPQRKLSRLAHTKERLARIRPTPSKQRFLDLKKNQKRK